MFELRLCENQDRALHQHYLCHSSRPHPPLITLPRSASSPPREHVSLPPQPSCECEFLPPQLALSPPPFPSPLHAPSTSSPSPQHAPLPSSPHRPTLNSNSSSETNLIPEFPPFTSAPAPNFQWENMDGVSATQTITNCYNEELEAKHLQDSLRQSRKGICL